MGEDDETRYPNDPHEKMKSVPETIKERIDRETNEQLRKPGRTFMPETQRSATEWNRKPGESYSANVVYDIVSGEPVGAEVLKNGEPFLMLKMSDKLNARLVAPRESELQAAYERGYQAAEARWIHREHQPGAEAKQRANEMTYTQQAIEDVAHTLGARGHSYTTRSEFENFEDQAEMGEMPSLRNVFRGMVGQKLTREKSIRARIVELGEAYAKGEMTEKEYDAQMDPDVQGTLAWSWLDSIRDVCGYGLLFFGWAKSTFDSRVPK